MSDWWGLPTSNGELTVRVHVDDPRLAPVHERMRQQFSAVVASMILADQRRQSPEPMTPKDFA